MSRDPTGLNPRDEYTSQLEPSGTRSDQCNEHDDTIDSSNIVRNTNNVLYDEYRGEDQADQMDMTKVLGLPPPPPPTTVPPRKKKKSIRRSTGSSCEPDSNDTNIVIITKHEASSKENKAGSSTSRNGPEDRMNKDHEINSVSYDNVSVEEGQQHILQDQSNLTEKMRSSSPLLNTRSIVEKRLLLAKSTYESDVLVLDNNPPTSSNGNVPLCINVGHIKEEDVITKTTRRRGGIEKRKEKKQNKRGFLKKLFGGGGGGEKQNYNNDDNNNNFDKVFPVSSSSNKQSSADNSSQKNPSKTTSVETDTVIDEEPTIADNEVASIEKQSLHKKLEPSPISTKSIRDEIDVVDESHIISNIMKPIDDITCDTLQSEDITEMNLIGDVTMQQQNVNLSRESTTQVQLLFSIDPPDDYQGDPPEKFGAPLLSPTAFRGNTEFPNGDTESTKEYEKTRIETVRSRIAEVYEEHNHYDTQQTMRSAINANSDGGITSLEELPNPKFQPQKQQDNYPDAVSKPAAFSKYPLRVQTQTLEENNCADPAGASPFVQGNDTPCFGTPMTRIVTGDPIGATPKAREVRTRVVSSNDPIGTSPSSNTNKLRNHPFESKALFAAHANADDSTIDIHKDCNTDPELNLVVKLIDDISDVDATATKPLKKNTESPLPLYSTQSVEFHAKEKSLSICNNQSTSPRPRKMLLNIDTSDSTEAGINCIKKTLLSSLHPKNNIKNITRIEQEHLSEMEKSGFKPSSNTSMATEQPLSVSVAAFTNAKAMAYLHQLHGEQSPRHSWHTSKEGVNALPQPVSEKFAVLAKLKKFNSTRMKNDKTKMKKTRGPSPYEYSATNKMIIGEEITKTELDPPKKNYVNHDPKKNFAPYSRFQGRRPRKNKTILKQESPNATLTTPVTIENLSGVERYKAMSLAIIPSSKLSTISVARGIALKHRQQVTGIPTRRALRVSLSPRHEGGNRFIFFPANESKIKDPIQRAGRKLLSKASIPIQSGVRMFLSKREAFDRMWAIVQIQSYMRRWRCEANFREHKRYVLLMQKSFRAYRVRQEIKNRNSSATLIQKIVRGYLAAIRAYDTIYYVSRAQALARGFITRTVNNRKEKAVTVLQTFCKTLFHKKNRSSSIIQKCYRAYHFKRNHAAGMIQKVYREYCIFKSCAAIIQSAWRSYSTRIGYEMFVVDVTITQSIVRRRAAFNTVDLIRKSMYTSAIIGFQALSRGHITRIRYRKTSAATKIQASWRRFELFTLQKKNVAATKIQSSWRRFHAYTDFIFVIVDILVVQRMVRQWLAIRTTNKLRKEKAATMLQSIWRKKKAQKNLLYSLVHIIMVQSVGRRYLSKKEVKVRRNQASTGLAIQLRKIEAATTIQKSWRGFWGFSHFIIVQYEITRVQALMRGKLTRNKFNLKLGCAILIQAVARRFLAKEVVSAKVASAVVVTSKVFELRERISAKRIQFWWRIVLDWMKEKRAALVIERFFIHVKAEVDRELRQIGKKAVIKQQNLNKSRMEKSRDKTFQNMWLNTADKEKPPTIKEASRNQGSFYSRPPPEKKLRDKRVKGNGKKVLKKGNFGHHDFGESLLDMNPPPEFLDLNPDFSMLSNITTPSILNRIDNTRIGTNPEEIYREVKSRPKSEKQRLSTEDYIKKYCNLQTAPNRLSKSDSFFSEESTTKSVSNKSRRQSSDGMTTTKLQHSAKGNFNFSGGVVPPPRVAQETLDMNVKVPATPRSRSGSTPRAARESFDMQIKVPSTPRSRSGSTPRAARESFDMQIKVPSTPRSRSGSSTPRTIKENFEMQIKVPTTPRSRSGSTPRAVSRSRRDGSSSHLLPPVTPTRKRSTKILHSGTADTASLTLNNDTMPMSISSPRKHPHIHGRGGNRVMIMKTQSDFIENHSVNEAHEILLLGDDYGEV